jgi:hypothetical protein
VAMNRGERQLVGSPAFKLARWNGFNERTESTRSRFEVVERWSEAEWRQLVGRVSGAELGGDPPDTWLTRRQWSSGVSCVSAHSDWSQRSAGTA